METTDRQSLARQLVTVCCVILLALGVAAGVLAFQLSRTNALLVDGNDSDQEADLRAEYQRVVLGCNTSGAIESTDELLRELCDEELPRLRAALDES